MKRRVAFSIFMLLLCATAAHAVDLGSVGDWEKYMREGDARRSKGDFVRAVESYSKAIKTDPDNAYGYNGRGVARTALKDFEGSIGDLTKAIELDPNFALAYFNRGWARNGASVYFKEGDVDGAIEDYSKYIALKPEDEQGYSFRGNLYSLKEEWSNAIADFTRAIELSPANLQNYLDRGYVYNAIADGSKRREDYAIAAGNFDEAIKLLTLA